MNRIVPAESPQRMIGGGPDLPSIAARAGPEHAGERLDRFLAMAATSAHLSRTRVKALIEAGLAAIDGAMVKDPSALLRSGQTASLRIPPPANPLPSGENIPLNIVFEDEYLIVIDKPAGLVVHPSPGHDSGTLVNALIHHCGASLLGVGGVRRPGIVHRLDKGTSGLIVAAKTDAAHQGLARLFADHGKTLALEREYLAFAWGVPRLPSGIVDTPLGRDPVNRQKVAAVLPGRGRSAVTRWHLLESFAGEASLLSCKLYTGRTHQIRVHMAHMGHPLLGDPDYGGGFKSKMARLPQAAQACLACLSRQALHAATLGLVHPATEEKLRLTSALPPELQKLHDALAGGNAGPPGSV